MLNSFSDYIKYKKKLTISYYQNILKELDNPSSNVIFDFITNGKVFTITQSTLTIYSLYSIYSLAMHKKLSFSTMNILKKNFIKYIFLTFVNMQFLLRSHKNEYPYKSEADLDIVSKMLIAMTGPSFCIIKDVNIIKAITFVRMLNPVRDLGENKNYSNYTIKM